MEWWWYGGEPRIPTAEFPHIRDVERTSSVGDIDVYEGIEKGDCFMRLQTAKPLRVVVLTPYRTAEY